MRLGAALLCALVLIPAAAAAAPTQPVGDASDHLIQAPLAHAKQAPRLDAKQATAIFLAAPRVEDWLDRYPPKPTTEATLKDGVWTVRVWSGKAGEIAEGTVDDATSRVTDAKTGPQVAWGMARGNDGAFGGTKINSLPVWLGFCAAFLLGLVDWRRLASLRNLDLLVLLSFSVSLWYFNDAQVFQSTLLVYPPLVYLLVRAVAAVRTGRGSAGRPLWPVWLLAAAAVFLMGFRVGLNIRQSNVIDVGYAGVIGADRIAHGQAPYGHFPVEDDLKPCGPADASGEIRDRVQTNGRCESANPLGDTYGPVAYAAYLPGYWALGWSGKWDDLPAAHFTSILWDVLAFSGCSSSAAATAARAWPSRSRSRGPPIRSRSTSRTRTRTTRSCPRSSSGASFSPPRMRPAAPCSPSRAGRSSPRSSSRRSGSPTRSSAGRACRRRSQASWSRPSPRSRCCCSSRTSATRSASSGTTPSGSR